MPKGNQKGGKKHKRNKNYNEESRSLRIKETGQEYAKVTKCKGNCRFDVSCCDGKQRGAILCGAMRKRKFINQGDLVLVSIREWQDDICDIIDSYDQNQAKKLKQDKHLPDTFLLGEENPYQDLNDEIEFSTDMPSDNSSDEGDNSDIDLEDI